MKTHEKLLNLLENGGDDAEFNARFWCWLNGYHPDCDIVDDGGYFISKLWEDELNRYSNIIPKYLTSLDACKAVMDGYLEGWCLEKLTENKKGWLCAFRKTDGLLVNNLWLPTEQRARLHAMIQAIAHERGEA